MNHWSAPTPTPAARVLVFGACAVIVAAGMQAAASLVSAVVLAVVLATVLAPLLGALRAHGVSSPVAILLVLLPVVGLGILFVLFLGLQLSELAAKLPDYSVRLSGLLDALSTQYLGDPHALARLLPSVTPDPGLMLGWTTRALADALVASNDLLLMLFILLFACLEAERFPRRLHALGGRASGAVPALRKLAQQLRDYVLLNGQIGVLVAVLRVVVLLVLGVDFAMLWGVWSLLLTYVPTVGYPLAVLPPTLLALVLQGPGPALVVFVAFGIINTAVYNVLQPRWAGESLNLSPLVVLVSLFLWGTVLGAMGALLAVPLTMMVRALLESSDESRWLADLMSDEIPPHRRINR